MLSRPTALVPQWSTNVVYYEEEFATLKHRPPALAPAPPYHR